MAKKAADLKSTLVIGERSAPNVEPAPSSNLVVTAARKVLSPGTQLEHYAIECELGAGGMGVVYKAHDSLLDRPVALKILPPHLCANEAFIHRLLNEARLQARIDSPHVVTLHALMERDVGWVLAMEYLDGETLEQRLRRQGPLSAREAVDVFAQASVGVEHIHRMGVIHQDLKPSNIFITVNGRLKLLDFGVAKLMDDRGLAQSGTMMGTLLYMSPEQIKGRQVDHRSDIYTLGIALFEAVTGRLPFERKTNYALMHAHVQENPPPPRKYQAEIPRELEKLILKAIAKEPNRRFQTIAQFRKALLRHRRGRGRQFRPIPAPAPRMSALPGTERKPLEHHHDQHTRKRELLGSWVVDGLVLIGTVALVLVLTGGFRNDQARQADNDIAAPISQDKYASLKKAWGGRSPEE